MRIKTIRLALLLAVMTSILSMSVFATGHTGVFGGIGVLMIATVIGLLIGLAVIKGLPAFVLQLGGLAIFLVIIGVVLANVLQPIGFVDTFMSNALVQGLIGFGAGVIVGESLGQLF